MKEMGVYLTFAYDVVRSPRGVSTNGERRENRRWPKRPVADRGHLTRLVVIVRGKHSFRAPITNAHQVTKNKQTQNVREEIRQGCGNCTVPSQERSPPDHGRTRTLRAHPRFFWVLNSLSPRHTPTQLYSYYKQGVCCKEQSPVI